MIAHGVPESDFEFFEKCINIDDDLCQVGPMLHELDINGVKVEKVICQDKKHPKSNESINQDHRIS